MEINLGQFEYRIEEYKESDFAEHNLNIHGINRWELISVISLPAHYGGFTYKCTFKRPIKVQHNL